MEPLNNPKTCLIIAGGEFAPLPDDVSFDFVIACDRGYEYAPKLGIRPDLIVGDFDSASGLPEGDVPVIRLPAVKDDTDTVSAVKTALEKGFRNILVCCAFGGRFDHSIANMQTAAFIAEQGGSCHFYGKDTELIAIKNGQARLPRRENHYLSVFSLTSVCLGVCEQGTAYEVSDARLTSAFPLGVSNEWATEEAVISVREGILAIVICAKD